MPRNMYLCTQIMNETRNKDIKMKKNGVSVKNRGV
jgi:hypothetical protein